MSITTQLLCLPLLLVSILAADIPTFVVTRENATHLIDDSFYEAAALQACGRLVYVSYPRVNNDTSVRLARDNGDGGSCEFRLPRVGYLSSAAASLGDGKLVVALVEDQQQQQQQQQPQARGVGVRFYVVDWQEDGGSCSYAHFAEIFGRTILDSYESFVVVPYRDSFDVLARSALHCKRASSMCLIRYSEEGERMGVRDLDLAAEETTSLDLVSIHPLREFDPSSGYVLVSKRTSRLHVLDADLTSLRTGRIPGYLTAHSVLNGDIGLCYEGAECAKLDARLKIKTRVATDGCFGCTRRIYNLLDGSSLLVTLSPGRRRLSVAVRRLGVDGRLGPADVALFRYDCESLYAEPRDYFAELAGDVYCFSFACRDGLITHCAALPPAVVDRLPSYLT